MKSLKKQGKMNCTFSPCVNTGVICADFYINFAALISDDTILLKHLYAESDAIVRLPVISRRATLLLHCSEDGLFEKKIRLF